MKKFKRKPVPLLPGVQIPLPVFTCAVEAADERKEGYLLECLENLSKEDPSFRYHTDRESGQLLMSGMGELHLEIVKDRLLNHYNVEAWVGKMRVSYRTSIPEVLDTEFEYVYELTGSKQRATIWLRLEPLQSDDDSQYLDNRILYLVPQSSWDTVPADVRLEVKEAIQEGVENLFRAGPIYSFPLHGIRAVIRDVHYHEDSTPGAFRACVSRMIRDMVKESNPVVLQPMMQVEVTVPEEHFGNVLNDIANHRKGTVTSVVEGGHSRDKVVSAEVPLKSMMGYSTSVRSISQGTASFSMDFLRYGRLSDAEIQALHKEYRGH